MIDTCVDNARGPADLRGDLVTEMAALRHAGPGDLYPATPWPDGAAAGSADGGCRVMGAC